MRAAEHEAAADASIESPRCSSATAAATFERLYEHAGRGTQTLNERSRVDSVDETPTAFDADASSSSVGAALARKAWKEQQSLSSHYDDDEIEIDDDDDDAGGEQSAAANIAFKSRATQSSNGEPILSSSNESGKLQDDPKTPKQPKRAPKRPPSQRGRQEIADTKTVDIVAHIQSASATRDDAGVEVRSTALRRERAAKRVSRMQAGERRPSDFAISTVAADKNAASVVYNEAARRGQFAPADDDETADTPMHDDEANAAAVQPPVLRVEEAEAFREDTTTTTKPSSHKKRRAKPRRQMSTADETPAEVDAAFVNDDTAETRRDQGRTAKRRRFRVRRQICRFASQRGDGRRIATKNRQEESSRATRRSRR